MDFGGCFGFVGLVVGVFVFLIVGGSGWMIRERVFWVLGGLVVLREISVWVLKPWQFGSQW